MKSFAVLFIIAFLSQAFSDPPPCKAPAPYARGGGGPFGFACSGNTVILPSLGSIPVVSFGAGNTVIVKKVLFANGPGPSGCGTYTFSWNVGNSYALTTNNIMKIEGYCSHGTFGADNGYSVNLDIGCGNYDATRGNSICGGDYHNCCPNGCIAAKVVSPMTGTLTLNGWGDCGGGGIFLGPLFNASELEFSYTPPTCFAPLPFIYQDSGAFGYTCSGTSVLLTQLNNAVLISHGTGSSKGTIVIAYNFKVGSCSTYSATLNLGTKYNITKNNFVKAEGWGSSATISDSNGVSYSVNSGEAPQNPSTASVCGGVLSNCCNGEPCDVKPVTTPLSGVVTISGSGDCGDAAVWGPGYGYNKTLELAYATPLVIASTSYQNASCPAINTGSATVVPSGGTPPYYYTWTGSSSTDSSATGLLPGSYTVTVTDSNDWTASYTFVITNNVVSPPFAYRSGTVFGYDCNNVNTVLTAFGLNVISVGDHSVVVNKTLKVAACDDFASNYVLPAGYSLSSNNYIQFDGGCGDGVGATVTDGVNSFTAALGACDEDGDPVQDPSISTICGGKISNCCPSQPCDVTPITSALTGTISITGSTGDDYCANVYVWGPGYKYNKNSMELIYTY